MAWIIALRVPPERWPPCSVLTHTKLPGFRFDLYNCTMDITIDTSAILAVCTNEGLKPRLVELTVGADC